MAAQDSRLMHLISAAKHHIASAPQRYRKLSTRMKLFIWATACLYLTLATTLILIGPDRIGQTFYNIAQKISHKPFGWAVLLSALVLVSIPPCIGHTTTVTLCGYAYGMNGFWLAAAGTQLGSAVSFVLLRTLFSRRIRMWTSTNDKWQALETVVAAKGLPLMMLIRASPFPPWVYSNALFASIEVVSLWQFLVATFVVFPKAVLFVFIGSRLALLSDGERRKNMDTPTKIVNIVITCSGFLLALTSSWVIYRAMKAEIRRLQDLPPEVDELAAEAIEDAEEGAPLLRGFSNDRSMTADA
ncbi:Golgi apparatus membrane protein TVP38 [Obba rivulosa]|uniref:Golgi apparatus membrane protein TVP38 n=1 Tax=Obba rivulosa TaxID=1052685 RepID=A0A8E2DIX3_9APHY|nr:Golgi apparatus membrane protein TVP38 [Obba rivulosa]